MEYQYFSYEKWKWKRAQVETKLSSSTYFKNLSVLLRQTGSPYQVINPPSVLGNCHSTDCWITVIILILQLKGGCLTSLFHFVFNSSLHASGCIICVCLHTSSDSTLLFMTWFFPVTLQKASFSCASNLNNLLERPARCQIQNKVRKSVFV